MTIVERLRDIAEGKCTGLLAEEAEALLDVVESAKAMDKNLYSGGSSFLAERDDVLGLRKVLAALSKLEAPDDTH